MQGAQRHSETETEADIVNCPVLILLLLLQMFDKSEFVVLVFPDSEFAGAFWWRSKGRSRVANCFGPTRLLALAGNADSCVLLPRRMEPTLLPRYRRGF